MNKYFSLLFFLLFSQQHANAQAQVTIPGNDSLLITIITDTMQVNKINLRVESLRHGNHKIYFQTFKEMNDLVYQTIFNHISRDSVKIKLLDSIRHYVKDVSSLELRIMPVESLRPDSQSAGSVVIIDTNSIGNVVKVPQIIPEEGLGPAIRFIIIIAGVLVLALLIWILLDRKKFLFFNKSPAEQPDTGNKDPDSKDILPKALLEQFNLPKQKDNTLHAIGERILVRIAGLENDLITQKGIYDAISKDAREYNEQLQNMNTVVAQQQRELDQMKQALENKQVSMSNQEQELNKIKGHAAQLIERYIDDLTRKVRDLSNMPGYKEEEIRKIILSNVFTFAFLSDSLLRKLLKKYSEPDEMNIRIIEGVPVSPNRTIHENTLSDTAYPLPVQIFNLLKQNGVDELKDVYIQGYKIGKSN